MPRSPHLRLLLSIALAVGMAALFYLSFLALIEAFQRGRRETLMMVWMLVFVIGLPATMLALVGASAWSTHRPGKAILPYMGAKIP